MPALRHFTPAFLRQNRAALIIRKQDHANVGDIVVALYQNENTLKRLRFDEQTQRYILHPENPDMKDIVLENAELRVQGVATFVIKAL